MLLALKTTQSVFVKKWSADWDEFYCPISSCDVVLWTDLITKKGFWGKTTLGELGAFFESLIYDEDIDVVYSQYKPYRIAISQSCPQHYAIRTFWPRDSKTIFESKIAQFQVL